MDTGGGGRYMYMGKGVCVCLCATTIHMTGAEHCGGNIANAIRRYSISFTVITHSDNIVLLTAATTS